MATAGVERKRSGQPLECVNDLENGGVDLGHVLPQRHKLANSTLFLSLPWRLFFLFSCCDQQREEAKHQIYGLLVQSSSSYSRNESSIAVFLSSNVIIDTMAQNISIFNYL